MVVTAPEGEELLASSGWDAVKHPTRPRMAWIPTRAAWPAAPGGEDGARAHSWHTRDGVRGSGSVRPTNQLWASVSSLESGEILLMLGMALLIFVTLGGQVAWVSCHCPGPKSGLWDQERAHGGGRGVCVWGEQLPQSRVGGGSSFQARLPTCAISPQ